MKADGQVGLWKSRGIEDGGHWSERPSEQRGEKQRGRTALFLGNALSTGVRNLPYFVPEDFGNILLSVSPAATERVSPLHGCLLTRNTGTWESGLCVVVVKGGLQLWTVGSVPSPSCHCTQGPPQSSLTSNKMSFLRLPVIQRLKLCAPKAGGPGLIPGELRGEN